MKMKNSIKLSWIVCGLGWVIAIISLAFLPDAIPTKFSDGVPGNFSDKYSIFLWPLIQVIVMLLGTNKNMLPRQLGELLTDRQYNWAVFGMILFVFLIELLIIYVACSGV